MLEDWERAKNFPDFRTWLQSQPQLPAIDDEVEE